jgi:hypothetical protein
MTPERRAFARAYPFALSDRSFVVDGGVCCDWESDVRLTDRTPVLAVGSNQSPEQIARKFPDATHGAVPVMRVYLSGFDSVYSAHITQYASVPATLAVCAEATAALCVTWLTDDQLIRMHRTEIPGENYSFVRLDGLGCRADTGDTFDTLFAYVSTRGHLTDAGDPIPLAEVPAEGRRWQAKTQPAMQDWVAARVAPGQPTDAVIDLHLSGHDARLVSMRGMADHAAPFDYDKVTAVDV